MRTLYRYHYTGVENATGAGIMCPEKIQALQENYFLLYEETDLSEVENETITIEEVSLAEIVAQGLEERLRISKQRLKRPDLSDFVLDEAQYT